VRPELGFLQIVLGRWGQFGGVRVLATVHFPPGMKKPVILGNYLGVQMRLYLGSSDSWVSHLMPSLASRSFRSHQVSYLSIQGWSKDLSTEKRLRLWTCKSGLKIDWLGVTKAFNSSDPNGKTVYIDLLIGPKLFQILWKYRQTTWGTLSVCALMWPILNNHLLLPKPNLRPKMSWNKLWIYFMLQT
jgi:hypothetical protein